MNHFCVLLVTPRICLSFISVVDCGLPPQPVNGWSSGNQTKFRSVIKFKCNKGYNLVGSETRICTSDKKWGGREAKCEGKDSGQ